MTKKSCKKGYYYCFTSKKCKKIPVGYHVMTSGRLMKDSEHKEEEETKKNGNGTNGNGNGNGDSSGSSDGGGVSEGWSAKYKRSIDCDNPKGFSQRAHCQGRKKVNEAKEKGDHEVSMAHSQLKKTERNIKLLRKALGKKEKNIPAWVQAKITDTEHNMDAAAGYMDEATDGIKSKDYKGRLDKWFDDGGWVQTGGKYDGKPCAKQPGQTTKPFCRDPDDRAAMSKNERSRRAAKKRREDPNPNRKGKARMVTASYSNWRADLEQLDEIAPALATGAALGIGAGGMYIMNKLRQQKKKSDKGQGDGGLVDKLNQRKKMLQQLGNSFTPEGEVVSEKKDACYRKVKSRYKIWPSAYASGALVKCRKVGAANWGNTSENYQDYDLRDEYIEENIIRAAKMATKVIKALGKSKVRKSLPPRNLRNLSPERKQEIMYQAQKRIKSYKPGEIDKSASRKYAADRLNTVYSRRQNVIKQGGSPKEAAAQSISSMGPADALGKDFNIKRGGRGRKGSHGPETDRGKGNKAARRSGQEVVDTGNIDVHYRPTRDQSIQRSRERRSMRSMERRLNRIQSDDRKAMSSMETRLNNLLNLNNSYEISNWKDDFKATEYESVDIIKTEPLQPSKGIGSDMLGEKCWDGYVQKGMKKKGEKVVPNCVKEEEKKVKRWWDDDGDGIGWEEGEVKKSKKKKKTRKEGFSNWREELSESGYDSTYGRGEMGEPKGTQHLKVDPKKYADDMKWWRENLKNAPPVRQASTKKTTQVAHFEPEGELIEDWQKVNKKDKTDGMSQKAVNAYRRENPGSKLKTAVTEKNPGGKRAKRRKSFCARSDGQRKMHNIDCSKTPDKAICKARKRWRC